ncbi:hypothetical protein FDECE_7646 [Fusarium decemcellulare]|nr:hypothetical protein FDECE_7646 [Fusarium decemcellulare]
MKSSSFVLLPALFSTAWASVGRFQPRQEATASADEATATDEPTSTLEETASTATSSGVTTHTVNVGASGHKFTPSEVKAEVGDIIEWRFYPSGHWVIRGDFENPCIPYEYVDLNRKGFSSGAQKVQAITDDAPRFRVEVNDTKPIWFYCGAPGSCVKYHMMGVVNPAKNETLDEWLEKAKDVDYQLRPGDEFPTEEGFPSATAKPNDDDDNSDESTDDSGSGGGSSHGLSSGAIAGIAIGAAAVLILAGGLIYLCGRRGGFDKAYRKSFRSSQVPPPVAETQFSTPNPAGIDPWAANKGPGLMATSYGQSPPMSPHQSIGYGHPGHQSMVAQDGTIGSYYSDNTYTQQSAASPSVGATTPKPPEQHAPVELPASADPGNSPLPSYNSNGNPRTFSWAGEETGYRPSK